MKEKFKKYKNRIIGAMLSVMTAATAIFATAAAEDPGLPGHISSITGALGDFSGTNIVTVLVAALGVAVPLILVWFAFRKVFAWAKGAFYNG